MALTEARLCSMACPVAMTLRSQVLVVDEDRRLPGLYIELIPTSFGLMVKSEDGLDDGGQAAG
ncbi:hypothetical protein AB0C74_40420 [Spirillospora sp. NPDC048832]